MVGCDQFFKLNMLNMADYDNQKMLSEVQLPCGRRLHNRFVKVSCAFDCIRG